MAIIDSVIWSPQGDEVVYAYKYPQDNLSTYTQLVVNESQVALLFSKGQLLGKFGPGKHTLNTENLPILRSLYGFPFGGKNPFTAQVWFVNLIETFNIPWSLFNLPIHDPDFQTTLPLFIEGQYGLKIIDPEKFLIKVVGTRNIFSQSDMTSQFTGEFTSRAKTAVAQFMIQNRIGYKQISAFLDPISRALQEQLNQFWADLGVQLTKFYVSNIDIDTTSPEGRKAKEAIASQISMSITGHTWQQEQMFGTANSAISQMGNMGMGGGEGSLLGGLMAINMMNNMGGGMGGAAMMNAQFDQPRFAPGGNNAGAAMPQEAVGVNGGAVKMVYCSSCAKKFPSSSAFCPHCGNKYRPCPNCGSDNPESARRCVSCGTALAGAAPTCPHCHTQIPAGCSFCPGCGQPVVQDSNICSRCGSNIPAGAKFCPRCGNKR